MVPFRSLAAALLVTFLALLFHRFHGLPLVEGILFGVRPVVVAMILQALRGLAQSSLRTLPMIVVAAIAFLMVALGLDELVVLVLCGGAAVLLRVFKSHEAAPALSLWRVDSNYVLLALVQFYLVQRLHWFTNKELLDAVAILLTAFAVAKPLAPSIRIGSAFVDGIAVGSLGLIAWVLLLLGRGALIDPVSIGVALVSFLLLSRFRVNAVWLVLGGGLVGAWMR